MIASVKSLGLLGINGFIVTAEVDVSNALPSFDIVGLPDAAVKESKDRVRSALKNCGLPFPLGKITVNLAPADIKKSGPIYDLPILVAILKATGIIDADLSNYAFIGELSLGGELRSVNGVLPMLLSAAENGIKTVVIPPQNAKEGGIADSIEVIAPNNILELISHLKGKDTLTPVAKTNFSTKQSPVYLDFADVKGQNTAKRALEIAAAGSHNILMIGAPGSGKSMLAKRLVSILPDLTFDEAVETTKIFSVAGCLDNAEALVSERPFRSPHHTVSTAGLCGGGSTPRPGEISLAHNGVLFLDELPEFPRAVTEVLRQPLEDGKITISRVSTSLTYPSKIMLVAAMNPCPCGYFGHPTKACTCNPNAVKKYLSKISGPLLDRIDLHIEVAPVLYDNLTSDKKEETSAEIKKRVNEARAIQTERYKGLPIRCNSEITPDIIHDVCKMSQSANHMLKSAFESLSLSARAYDRILKVARTIADLDGSKTIENRHIAEAIQYRTLDRKYWA